MTAFAQLINEYRFVLASKGRPVYQANGVKVVRRFWPDHRQARVGPP